MNCYGAYPSGYQQVQPTTMMTNTSTMPTRHPVYGATTSTNSWGYPVPADPTNPSSPLSVVPTTQAATTQATTTSSLVPPTTLPAPIPDPGMTEPLPPTLTETIYTPGYLRQHLGNLMRVEFLIGNAMTDRIGYLKTVGASYIVLTSLDGGTEVMCDIYSIKFITIIQSQGEAQLYATFQ